MSSQSNRIRLTILLSICLFGPPLTQVAWALQDQPHVQDTDNPGIQSIRTVANVTVSDGMTYNADTYYRDPQRAIFKLTYPDRVETYGIDGKYIWQYDSEQEKEASEFHRSIVLGHQVHAQLLFFSKLNSPTAEAVESTVSDATLLSIEGENGYQLTVDSETKRAVELRIQREDEADIVVTFDSWKQVEDVALPFVVKIDDGERQFTYDYQTVEFNRGNMNEYRCPVDKLTDEQQLLRAHRLVMDAHLDESVEGLADRFGSEVVFVNSGEVETRTGEEALQGLGRIFSNRDYTVYDDLMRPRVNVSEDGTLGWVIVKISARGIRLDEAGSPTGPLEFVCAWISTYEKQSGKWKMVGNVSNFEPGRK